MSSDENQSNLENEGTDNSKNNCNWEKRIKEYIQLFLHPIIITIIILVILLFIVRYSSFSPEGVSILISLASLSFGLLIGFIFGLPRAISENSSFYCNMYEDNSNLDQISDWLLKILVGVGLTQLILLPRALTEYVGFIRPALGDTVTSGTVGISLLIIFSVNGFPINNHCKKEIG